MACNRGLSQLLSNKCGAPPDIAWQHPNGFRLSLLLICYLGAGPHRILPGSNQVALIRTPLTTLKLVQARGLTQSS